MRIKTIERIKFRLSGRSVPVVRVTDSNEKGQINTLHLLGELKARPNSLINTWDEKGYEIIPGQGFITLIDESGIPKGAYVVSSAGMTTNLYTEPVDRPNLEDVIGHAATMDDIADSMDLGKSLRNMAIGFLIGAGVGALILGPMFTKIMS